MVHWNWEKQSMGDDIFHLLNDQVGRCQCIIQLWLFFFWLGRVSFVLRSRFFFFLGLIWIHLMFFFFWGGEVEKTRLFYKKPKFFFPDPFFIPLFITQRFPKSPGLFEKSPCLAGCIETWFREARWGSLGSFVWSIFWTVENLAWNDKRSRKWMELNLLDMQNRNGSMIYIYIIIYDSCVSYKSYKN